MTRNPSYGSLPPEKPTCPNCGNIIALTCDTCLQCGFSQFLIRGTGVSKVACTACEGNGKKEWYAYSSGDYCDNCKGRGIRFHIHMTKSTCAPTKLRKASMQAMQETFTHMATLDSESQPLNQFIEVLFANRSAFGTYLIPYSSSLSILSVYATMHG